ncbi:MAG: metalloregulator ArsR/SmtB family transcription factor [Rhodobacteraceae bacterium]|nr:metalloregulator ArsR/SmtB family transcription factor [Paracoccaceae bacterium]MCF8513873.1 metalloregulator ArsR/SmtB family transcription factor [Paracoccaceae bacterium]MCF8518117.1 metalloregulator ArsR/SmtB family transcription factor [Paracoccaceae bacterium]
MEMKDAAPLFATLGHPDRLAVFRLLLRHAPQGVQPSHIAGVLGVKANTLSHHLSDLAQAGLVQVDRRGRALFYTVDLERVKSMLGYLVEDCCRGRADLCLPASPAPMTDGSRPLNVLFVCSGNSARSLMAEALLHHANPQRFRVHSAGTTPANAPHPMAIEVLKRAGIDISPLHPKSLAQFQTAEAPKMDFIFTLCDHAASEDCPPWQGQPFSAHWGLPDPAKADGNPAEQALAFATAFALLNRRISAFAALPFAQLDAMTLQHTLDQIAVE